MVFKSKLLRQTTYKLKIQKFHSHFFNWLKKHLILLDDYIDILEDFKLTPLNN